jgi:hypothetical protein
VFLVTREQEGSPFDRIRNATAAFLRIRDDSIAESRQDYERARYVHSFQQQERKEQADAARDLLLRTGLDLEYVNQLEAADDQLRQAFLEEVRPPLVDRSLAPESRLHDRMTQAALHGHVGDTPTLLGASVITRDVADGQPVDVWLHDPEQVKYVADADEGFGWDCEIPWPHEPAWPFIFFTASWFYAWQPPETGLYLLVFDMDYSGFYIARANDRWYNCKRATAIARVGANVHQGGWHAGVSQTILSIDRANVQQAGRLEGHAKLVSTESLASIQSADEVVIRVVFGVGTDAQGSGSYAEINFKDGEASYLSAPSVHIVKIWPLPTIIT